MKDTTLISVVTPIYNGASFIMGAYDCLCHQTYRHWEWVVVDDGSTDNTQELVRQISDNDHRVKYTWQRNSGSAKLPRDRAVFQAKGALVLPFDIDDRIADDYLEKMLQRMTETDADIVYPQMIFVDLHTNTVTQTLPVGDFDITRTYHGKELIRETMPEWRIGCNGGLYRRHIWVNMSWLEEHDPIWTYSDEVDERYYLLNADNVAFAKAHYYYQNHENSITNKPSLKLFHLLKNNSQLAELMEQEFGRESEEFRLANQKVFYSWRSMTAYYFQHYREFADADAPILNNIIQTFSKIDPKKLPLKERIKFLNLTNAKLLLVLMSLKYAPKWIGEKIMQRYQPEKYRYDVVRCRAELHMRQQMQSSYEYQERKKNLHTCVVYMSCGNVASGGLVDRLRGAVSLYSACKEVGRDFRLFFTHPFPLTDYLQPNDYDWRISEEEVSFHPNQTHIVTIDTQTDSTWERQLQREKTLNAMRENVNRQLHFYSNASYAYDQDFPTLFNEMFKPSARLQQSIDKTISDIGGSYITISARFCNLLGDFNEEVFSEPLPRTEQKALIEACMKQIERIHQKNSDMKIVVCSDSITFAERAQQEDYVFVIPGTVSHIGNDTLHYYHYYEKTFLDFFVISKAKQVFLLKADGMHNSGFPYAAARIGKRPYQVVEF
jgi:glycosyltransferase involved in cell wall biosynthesis